MTFGVEYIRQEGRTAFYAGRSVRECPYSGKKREAWLKGWYQARDKAETDRLQRDTI